MVLHSGQVQPPQTASSKQLNHPAKYNRYFRFPTKYLNYNQTGGEGVYKRVLLMLPQLPYVANFLRINIFVNLWQNGENEILVNRIP